MTTDNDRLDKRFKHLTYQQRRDIYLSIENAVGEWRVTTLKRLAAEKETKRLARKYGLTQWVIYDVYEYLVAKKHRDHTHAVL